MSENKLKNMFFKYSWCLVKIIVEDGSGNQRTGTGFHIGKGIIATAKHVLENKKILSVQPEPFVSIEPVKISRICLSTDGQSDVAVLETNFSLEKATNRVSFAYGDKKIPAKECKASYIPLMEAYDDWIGSELILSRCIIMGYPVIPGSTETTLSAVAADINAIVDSYLQKNIHYIISSIPRGGFSGAPVISEYDFAMGIVTTSFTQDAQPLQLGFCGAVSVEPLFVLLDENKLRPEGMSDEFWEG